MVGEDEFSFDTAPLNLVSGFDCVDGIEGLSRMIF